MGERCALQELVFSRKQEDRQGRHKECRCKVVKLADKPTLHMLTEQIQVLISWLQTAVCYDGDVDVDFAALAKDDGDDDPFDEDHMECLEFARQVSAFRERALKLQASVTYRSCAGRNVLLHGFTSEPFIANCMASPHAAVHHA